MWQSLQTTLTSCTPLSLAFCSMPSSSMASMVALAAAQPNMLPPYVPPCRETHLSCSPRFIMFCLGATEAQQTRKVCTGLKHEHGMYRHSSASGTASGESAGLVAARLASPQAAKQWSVSCQNDNSQSQCLSNLYNTNCLSSCKLDGELRLVL